MLAKKRYKIFLIAWLVTLTILLCACDCLSFAKQPSKASSAASTPVGGNVAASMLSLEGPNIIKYGHKLFTGYPPVDGASVYSTVTKISTFQYTTDQYDVYTTSDATILDVVAVTGRWVRGTVFPGTYAYEYCFDDSLLILGFPHHIIENWVAVDGVVLGMKINYLYPEGESSSVTSSAITSDDYSIDWNIGFHQYHYDKLLEKKCRRCRTV